MAARPRVLSRARPAILLLALVGLVAFGAFYLGFVPRGRRERKPVHLHTLDAESTILPRREGASRAPVAASTRSSMQTIQVEGAARRYLLVEPEVVDRARTYPVVLVFHGDGGDARGFHDAFAFEKATGADAIVAYPEGLRFTWDLETTIANREVKLARAVVDEIAGRFPIDRRRVFAVGYSSGGFIANVIACQDSPLLRAISSSAGGAPYKQAIVWPNGYPRCPSQTPVATLALHGEDDHEVTLDSGRFSAEYWAYVNGCKTEEMESTGYSECRAYQGCPPGKAVAFCSVPSLGHWVWDRTAEASWTFFRLVAKD